MNLEGKTVSVDQIVQNNVNAKTLVVVTVRELVAENVSKVVGTYEISLNAIYASYDDPDIVLDAKVALGNVPE